MDSHHDDLVSAFDAREYLRVLWRRRWVVIVAIVIAAVFAGLYAEGRAPSYTAHAEVLVQPTTPTGNVNIDTEIAILQSDAVRRVVARSLPQTGSVTGQQSGQATVIDVAGSGSTPNRAIRVTNAWANAYVKVRGSQQDTSQAQKQVTYLQQQISQINKQEVDGTARINRQYGTGTATGQAQLRALQQSLDPQRAALVSQLVSAQADLQPAQTTGSAAQLLSPATSASSSGASLAREVVIGAAGGLLIGALLALLFEWLDDRIGRMDDLVKATDGRLPVLASLPRLKERQGQMQVVTRTDILSHAADSFIALRTTLHAGGLDQPGRRLEFVGVTREAGASTTLANLAVLMADAGRPVIMVDCDLRRPSLHTLFGLPNKVGLSSICAGDAPARAGLQPVPGSEQLFLLSAGTCPPNPAEMLSSPALAAVFDELTASGATLLIDCPSVLSGPDAAAVAVSGQVDALVLLVAHGTHQRQLRRSLGVLGQVGAEPAGLIFTGSDNASDGYESRQASAVPQPTSAGGRHS